MVTIELDTPSILTQESEYRKAVDLCEKGRFPEAKSILRSLIQINPSVSEYHRILGQSLSIEGDQDEAINCLIDSLRWDSRNGFALVMLGNIFGRFKNDMPTAMKYYDQAVTVNPNDSIALNNIGAFLLEGRKYQEAKKYFLQALAINPKYPNIHHALGVIARTENDLPSAFASAIASVKFNDARNELFKKSVNQAYELAEEMIQSPVGMTIVTEYLHKLEFEGGVEIDILPDAGIQTSAKFELAENYSRPKHTVRYKPGQPAHEHLIMHELAHLDLMYQARKENQNQVFVSNPDQRNIFFALQQPTITKLRKRGIPEDEITNFISGLFDGMNLQLFNTPVDLFIENFIYSTYPQLRPYQFLSLSAMILLGAQSVTDKDVIELSPKDILSKTKIYNLVNAMQFHELYGIDLSSGMQATPAEIKTARGLYDEFLEYKDDKEPGEEYDLVQHWAEDLKLDRYFELIPEDEYRNKRLDINNLLDSIERDPFDLESKDPVKEREMALFQQSQKEIGINMAVVMFMVGALEYFHGMPASKIQQIAHEIAIQGSQGYNPDKSGYKLSTVPGKVFSGYHILAWYYISWMLSNPVMVPQLQLPFEKEYHMALTMFNPNK